MASGVGDRVAIGYDGFGGVGIARVEVAVAARVPGSIGCVVKGAKKRGRATPDQVMYRSVRERRSEVIVGLDREAALFAG